MQTCTQIEASRAHAGALAITLRLISTVNCSSVLRNILSTVELSSSAARNTFPVTLDWWAMCLSACHQFQCNFENDFQWPSSHLSFGVKALINEPVNYHHHTDCGGEDPICQRIINGAQASVATCAQIGKIVIIINIVIVINFEISMILIGALRRPNMSVNDEWDARR